MLFKVGFNMFGSNIILNVIKVVVIGEFINKLIKIVIKNISK